MHALPCFEGRPGRVLVIAQESDLVHGAGGIDWGLQAWALQVVCFSILWLLDGRAS